MNQSGIYHISSVLFLIMVILLGQLLAARVKELSSTLSDRVLDSPDPCWR